MVLPGLELGCSGIAFRILSQKGSPSQFPYSRTACLVKPPSNLALVAGW